MTPAFKFGELPKATLNADHNFQHVGVGEPSCGCHCFSTMLRLCHLRCTAPSTIGLGRIGDFRRISTIHPSLPHPVVELPYTPRYPCPFISEADIKTYLLPLYSSGWGVSAQRSNNKLAPPTTQLSKRILLPSSDMARLLRQDVDSHIIKLENVNKYSQLQTGFSD